MAIAVAAAQVGGLGLAAGGGEDLEHAPLGEAGDAALRVGVRDRAAADDGAGREGAGVGGVLDEPGEGEVHLGAGLEVADEAAVQPDLELEVGAPLVPGAAQLVGGGDERREGGGGLRLEEAESLRELVGDQVPQGAVVQHGDEPDVLEGVLGAGPHRDVAQDDRHLPLEIEPHEGVGELDVLGGAEQDAAAPLVDERVGLHRGGELGAPGLPDQAGVVQVGRPVDPLVGPGQRRLELVQDHRVGRHPAVLQLGVELPQKGLHLVPAVQGGLEGRDDVGGAGQAGAVRADDAELSVAGAVAEGRKSHGARECHGTPRGIFLAVPDVRE